MSTLSIVAWSLFSIAVALRLSCGRYVHRSSQRDDDVESDPPLARRWFGRQVVDAGALLSVVLLALSAGLLFVTYYAAQAA